ncbi:MAG: DUF6159 family protein [Myxococcota bacterium]
MSEPSKGGSIRRSRAILRAAFQTLRRNPRLAWFPILSGLGMVALMLAGGAIVGLGTAVSEHSISGVESVVGAVSFGDHGDPAITRAASIGGILLFVGGHLLMVGIGVAMTHAALEALAGRPWSVRGSLRVASQRRRAVATFALIQAVVSHVLRGGGSRKGKRGRRRRPGLFRRLAQFAWWALTYLALPVIAREGRGGIAAIERSASLLRETWKETVVARLTLRWLWVPAILLSVVPVVLCAALGLRDPVLLTVTVAIPLFGLGVLGLVIHTLDGIYRAALYTYATEGVVPEAFVHDDLDEIWETRVATGEVIDAEEVDRED